MYGALVYLFNKGLDDFRAPLEELLVVLRNSHGESAVALGYVASRYVTSVLISRTFRTKILNSFNFM